MEKINFNYSPKNIPIPPTNSYMKSFIAKVESLIRRMRWKAFFFDEDSNTPNTRLTYGFNTENSPPVRPLLTPFENDMYAWIDSIQFSKHRSDFQKKLTRDRKTIQSSPEVYVPADKSTNIYKMSPDNYSKLLHDNVTATYKKTNANTKRTIDLEAKAIATDLNLADRIEQIAETEAFITLKDHKENFENNPKCRLINPSKSEIGIISKHHLQEINKDLRSKTKYLQWTNTQSVLRWFENIQHGTNQKFVQFDIVEFYPSITKKLLTNAIKYAQSITNIEEKIVDIVLHSRQSLLFTKDSAWTKKKGNTFDVTMGSYDGAEVCELVGIYLLHQVNTEFPNINFGLYRDDGLGNYTSMPGPTTERTRKAIIKIFKKNGLNITIDMNMIQSNFLDVSLNIETGKYKPYRKPNNMPLYINKKSNHPPTIIKQIPTMIQTRISDLSCNEEEFENAKGDYSDALNLSGHEHNLEFRKSNTRNNNQSKRKRRRKILWFNPPYNESVTNCIEKEFYQLLDRHFPRHHHYYSLFNRHNVRLSYSCTQNMKAVISSHNKKLLAPTVANEQAPTCNCRQGTVCPLNGICLTPAIVYQGHIHTNNGEEHYTGLTEPPWKTRYHGHTSSFRHIDKRNETALSKRFWELRDAGEEPTFTWSLLTKSHPYRCGSRVCDLCLTEKLAILKSDKEQVHLNIRSELMNKCRHSRKFKLVQL